MEPQVPGEQPEKEPVTGGAPEEAAEQAPPSGEAAAETEKTPEAPEAPAQDKAEEPAGKAAHKSEKARRKEKNEALALQAEVERLQKELAEAQDRYQRMLAEYANYKRRTEQEKERIGEFTKAEILKSLLVSLDNMERAIQAPAGDEYKKGVDMVLRQFCDSLAAMGLEEIAAEGAPFNPEVHNAVMREDAEGVEPETVTEVFQKGYAFGGRVLRPAMVKVAN